MGQDGDHEPTASADPSEEHAEEPVTGDEAPEGFDGWRNESVGGIGTGTGTGIARGL
jgi:hypothetical protein